METRSIADCIAKLESEYDSAVVRLHADFKSDVAKVESNYLAAQILAADGIDVRIGSYYPSYASCLIDKGDLVKVRKALGCPLTLVSKDPDGDFKGSRTRIIKTLLARDFPGLQIRYKDKIAPGSKCKVRVVKNVSRCKTIVCEA